MKYDFHLFDAAPLDVQRKFAGIFETFGMTDLARQKVAVFSDPDAVKALGKASSIIRDCFVDHGFNLICHASEVRGSSDTGDRADLLARLKAEIDALPADVDWNGFDVTAFLAAAETPLSAPEPGPAPRPAMRPKPTVSAATNRPLSRPMSAPAPSF